MPLLKILTYPNPKLRKISSTCRPEKNLSEIQTLIDKMFKTMKFYQGCGLAASQVGISLRVIVIDVEEKQYAMINPKILYNEGNFESPEACLSFPYVHGYVNRFSKITVEFLDREGNKQLLEAEGLLAACIQHEIDHCNGILYIEHLSKLQQEMILKKIKKRMLKLQSNLNF